MMPQIRGIRSRQFISLYIIIQFHVTYINSHRRQTRTSTAIDDIIML